MTETLSPVLPDDIDRAARDVLEAACARKLSLATAESCTGGMLASLLTDVEGVSSTFERGFVTYSNAAKTEQLGVDPALIAQHGAVSEVVARAMAFGAVRHSQARVSIAVTGIAGPDGGTPEKPVGTVWLAWAAKGRETIALKQITPRNRKDFKLAVSQAALDGVRRLIP